jgi:hypothetical protein
MRTISVLVCSGVALGCGTIPPRYALTKSTMAETLPKAACSFRVVNLTPSGPYEEIATLSSEQSWVRAYNPVDFEARVRDQVCSIGGDIVVTEINGNGAYVRGTVLRAVQASELNASMVERTEH